MSLAVLLSLNHFLQKSKPVNRWGNPHVRHHSCTQCACNHPILAALKDELFDEATPAALPAVKTELKQDPAQTLKISGGTIRPMIEGKVATVAAIGIADGQVVVAGDENQVKNYMRQHHSGFRQRVLKGAKTLLPGLIGPHIHIVPTVLPMGWLDLSGFEGQELRKGYSMEMITKLIHDQVPAVKGRVAAGLWPGPGPDAFDR